MSFFISKLLLAIPLAIGTLVVLAPASLLVMKGFGWELSLGPDFLEQFLKVAFWLYELVMIGVFVYTVWEECPLPDLKKSNLWHLFLYPVLPPILLVGFNQGVIPAELFAPILACLLVAALFNALAAREMARKAFQPDLHPSFFE